MESSAPRLPWIRLSFVVILLAAFATRVVPVISSGGAQAGRDAAVEDCRRIRAALDQYIRDTGRLPIDPSNPGMAFWLRGDGDIPELPHDPDQPPIVHLRRFLGEPGVEIGGPFWEGPYLTHLGPDPWGRAYLVRLPSPGWTSPTVWILSAGPDGILDTLESAPRPRNDDVGLVLGLPPWPLR